MKKLLTLIGVAALLATNLNAQTTNKSWWDGIIGFAQNADAGKQLTIAAYPGYAPDLTVDGKKSPWGMGVAALYPVGTQFTLVGARIDWLANTFWMPSVNLTVKADVQLFSHNFTPFLIGGAIIPLSGAGTSNNGEVGSVLGGGVFTTVWSGKVAGKDGTLQIFAAYERWSNLSVDVYRPGVAFTVKW